MSSTVVTAKPIEGTTKKPASTTESSVVLEIHENSELEPIAVITRTRLVQQCEPGQPINQNPHKRNPCCGCDLKTGLIIMASIDIGRSTAAFVFLLLLFYRMMPKDEFLRSTTFLASGIMFSMAELCFSVGLLSATIKNRTGWVFVNHMAGWVLLLCSSVIYGFFFFRNDHETMGTMYLIGIGITALFRIYEAVVVYYFVNEPIPVPVHNIVIHGHGFQVYRHASHDGFEVGHMIKSPTHPLADSPTDNFKPTGSIHHV